MDLAPPQSDSSLPPPPPPAGPPVGGGPPSASRPRLGPVRPGQATLLVVAAITLVEGIGTAIARSDAHLSGVLALAIGGVLFALAVVRRPLAVVPGIRSLLAVIGTLLVSSGIGLVTDGAPPALRVALAGVAALLLAGFAARGIPSAVAASLATLAVIATPALVIAIAGAPVVGAALGGAVALAALVVAGLAGRYLTHPQAPTWVAGTGALLGAGVVSVLTGLDGGVAIAAAVFAAVGLVAAAERRRSVVLAIAAFFLVSATVVQAVILSGGSTASVAAVLIVAGVLLAAAAVLVGAFSSRLLVVSGGSRLPMAFDELVIAVAAVLALVAATGTPGGAVFRGPFTPTFGSSGGSISTSAPAPVPTDVNGVPCPAPQSGVVPPPGC
jgi:hypothetical protein